MGGVLRADVAWAQWDAMVHAANGVLGSRDDAAECATQALVQVLERPPVEVLNPEAFMVTIARRRAIDHVRSQARYRKAAMRSAPADLAIADIAEAVCEREQAAWVDELARRRL